MNAKCAFLFLAVLVTAITSQASIVLSNLSGDSTGELTFGYDDDILGYRTLAQAVHTGTGAPSYSLDEIQISTYLTIDSSTLPVLSIYADSPFPNQPGNVIGSMTFMTQISATAVPEPSAAALLVAGLAAFCARRKRSAVRFAGQPRIARRARPTRVW